MSLVSANIKWWQELPKRKDSITMPTDEENNAAIPQYITSNDLIGVKIPTFSWDEPDLPQAFKKFRKYWEILLSTPTYSRKTGKE